ncbi:hypothetical protein QR680_016778 [Steinernema hermaphroditum]|uniref:Uncharacterized protein n=1 Tax=Steinernema hermaphroditum TaxID=289476 RepID=A0AA39LMH5_9BILA|nr:hypothetical protein QR680_016778 [Steinernema hermaphroditum]
MIYSEPVTSSQPIPIQPGTFSSFSLPARAGALSERVVNTRRGTDAVVARLQELRESSSMSSVANASGSRTHESDRYCDVFDCDLDFDERSSSDAENCGLFGAYPRQRRETFAKRSSIDSLLEHYDSESYSEEGSSNNSSDADEECEDCECGCSKNAYISRRFLNHRKAAVQPNNPPFNPYADNSDLEMMELDHEDLMPPANIRSVGDVIGYVNVVRAERQEALRRLEGLLSQIGETWMNKKNQYNMAPQH